MVFACFCRTAMTYLFEFNNKLHELHLSYPCTRQFKLENYTHLLNAAIITV